MTLISPCTGAGRKPHACRTQSSCRATDIWVKQRCALLRGSGGGGLRELSR
jgi:hypothetical protein